MWAEIYAGIRYLVPLDPEAYMGVTSSCFSNPADLPPDPRRMHTGSSCFTYQGDVPPGPRRMHTGSTCFRY